MQRILTIGFWLSLTFFASAANPNILFIAIDDLRTELGCYGAEHIVSPNIDKLAASGVCFDRAYCQQAICGPSRASIMTGLRPDSTQVHGNHTHFRKISSDIVTLPQHFKNHGYHTQSMGKIYHGVFPPGSSKTVADTFGDEPSWSVPTFRPGPRYYYTEEGIAAAKGVFAKLYGGKGDWTQKLVFGPATEAPDVEDSVLYDGQVADRAVTTLKELGSKKDEPFFLAVGFIKPHSPYIAPKRYWDLYDEDKLALAENQTFPENVPSLAGHGSGELRRYTDQQKRGEIPDADQRRVRHAYYACISYIDAQVGKVLDELERQGLADETVVVLWADHGYHLGEKGLWGKTTNYELDARVPLMIRAPGRAGNGKVSPALVELVDLYPTLAELAGLPVAEGLEGSSLVGLLDRPDRRWKSGAFSQFTRGKRRGYSVVSKHYRYVEWYEIASAKVIDRELYDHRSDPAERVNLEAERPDVALRMSRLLDRGEGWRDVALNPDLMVADIFGDHMVLQRGKPLPVWGTASPGASVTVSFGGQSTATKADRDGQWKLELSEQNASAEGRSLVVSTGDTRIVFDDVLVGEVWLCAGQSNMRWMVKQSAGGADTIPESDNPNLRLIDFTGHVYPNAKRYMLAELRAASIGGYYATQGWRPASPETVPTFSAVAYYFGAKLQRELGVPVGLVHNAIGGVPMESYIPPEIIENDPELSKLRGDWTSAPTMPSWVRKRGRQNLMAWEENPIGIRPHHPFEPGFLFEAGMRPLVPMGLAGFLWYQGESNATEDGAGSPMVSPVVNKVKFKTLIAGWRAAWKDEKLPFYFAQLPGLNRDWEAFREMQLQVSKEVANTGMAVTIDLGHPTNVHPKAKKPVGERLASQALVKTYKVGELADGPAMLGLMRKGGRYQGATMVRFVNVGAGLKTSDGEALRGFMVADRTKQWRPADAKIVGRNEIELSNTAAGFWFVRYAWADHPDGNLVNSLGFPASPFRSDSYPLFVKAPVGVRPGAGRMSFEKTRSKASITPAGKRVVWKIEKGHAEITDRFAYSGSRSLHILGGDKRTVELTPAAADRPWGQLSFRAERWTKRDPFEFRVEALEEGKWTQIYNGDKEIKVGARFLSQVTMAAPPAAEKFRFVCTAPKGGGILIDDVALAPAKKMEVAVNVSWPFEPVLIGKRDNPVLRIQLDADGGIEPQTVREILVSAAESDRVEDIKSARVLIDGQQFGKTLKPAPRMQFQGNYLLQQGKNTFVVSYELAEGASIDRRVKATCRLVTIGKGVKQPTAHDFQFGGQRVGVALRQRGQDKSDAYRIPGLATTNEGTLIAVYDNRYRGGGDLPGDIDVGMSRSTDGGQTWEPMKVIMDMGNDPKWRYDGIGDPAVLVDRETNTVWVAATWSHGNRSWHGSGPGMKPEETGQFMLVKSEDDGATWSKPINITTQIKDPNWRFVLQGPGKGITLKDGTLVFPAQFRGENEAPVNGKPFATLIYSKDRGETWTIGTGVKIDTTEAQLVELGDDSIMINCRDNRGGSRSIYTTRDLGKTWQEHPTTRGALPEPVCMASLIRVEHAKFGDLLFFSNPAQTRGRQRMTIKVSDDEGMTWPESGHTLIHEGASMYSCMTAVGDEHIGLLYEVPSEIYFVRIPISELFGAQR